MKKVLLSLISVFALTSTVNAQTIYDFDDLATVAGNVRTYSKDIAVEGETSGLQEVSGWTAVENGDARAAGVYAYGSEYFLGGAGYLAPATNPEGEASGNALGLNAVWSAKTQYTTDATLEAGNYEMTITLYNSGAGRNAFTKSLFGFVTDDKEYLSTKTQFDSDKWSTDKVTFVLAEATTGKISVGFIAPNAGTGSNHHLFVDKIVIKKITEADVAREELGKTITSANNAVKACVVGEGLFMYPQSVISDFQELIDVAEGVAKESDDKDAIESANSSLGQAIKDLASKANLPVEGTAYTISNKTAEGMSLGISTEKVSLEENAKVFFTPVEGGYAISNQDGEYIYKTTANTWTLSTTTNIEEAYVLKAVVVEGGYTLSGSKGLIGSDNVGAGSSLYANKGTGNNGIWDIAEYVAPSVTYTGVIYQSLSHPQAGNMGSTTTEQTVTITEVDDAHVNITYSGFQIPVMGTNVPEFTINNVEVTANEDGSASYKADGFKVSVPMGNMFINYNGSLEGTQTDMASIPVLKLTLANATTDETIFGDADTVNAIATAISSFKNASSNSTVKKVANGKVVIVKNGVTYGADGAIVK